MITDTVSIFEDGEIILKPQSDLSVKNEKINLIGLSRSELEALVLSLGLEKFRTKQIWHWIYHRGARDFDEMTSLGKGTRAELKASCELIRPK
ncbi:MAG: hypothetical protein ACO3MJ_10785, partial [Alphaproteobacteria bacterium]